MIKGIRLFALAVIILTPLMVLQPSVASAQDSEGLRAPVYHETTGFWVQGPFREYWETHGGLFIFGYPITRVFLHEDGYYKQYFERAIFEYHDEFAGTEYEVLLQRLGAIRTEDRTGEAPFLPLAEGQSDENCNFYPETSHRLCFGFKNYWNEHGGLPNFGFPISEEFDERNQEPPAGDGEIHTVQYFERARFEYHPEFKGTPYETLLGLLGSEYLVENGAPEGATVPQPGEFAPADLATGTGFNSNAGYNVFLKGPGSDSHGFNQRTLELVQQAGFSWIHIQAQWKDLEHSGPGLYDPLALDYIVEQTARHGVQMLVSIVGPAPGWAGEDFPADTEHFEDLMHFLADRYSGKVQAWEIWNEQNLADNSGGTVNPAGYLELLKAGYNGVKDADPQAQVLFGALTPTGVNLPDLAVDDVLYLEQIYAINNGEVSNYYDVLGAHPGSNNNSPDQMWPDNPGPDGWSDHRSFYFRRIEDMRAVMVANGDADKDIWLTEFGWSTLNQAPGYGYGEFISDQTQADYLARAFEIGRTEWPWMGVMFVWNLNYSVITDPADEKHPWATLTQDWSPRPSYIKLGQMPRS